MNIVNAQVHDNFNFSEDQNQREHEKSKLEKAYKESDRKLDKHLSGTKLFLQI